MERLQRLNLKQPSVSIGYKRGLWAQKYGDCTVTSHCEAARVRGRILSRGNKVDHLHPFVYKIALLLTLSFGEDGKCVFWLGGNGNFIK